MTSPIDSSSADQFSSGDEPDINAPEFVKGVFDRCSGKYIAFSNILSFGFTERWRRQCVEQLEFKGAPPAEGYDIMSGTGEAWPHLLRRFPTVAAITAVDISSGMHRRAMDRLHRRRTHVVKFIEDDVLKSTLPNSSADFIVSTFGLKTFNSDQHRRLAKLVSRVLRPGGSFSFIEASDARGWVFGPVYRMYLGTVLPVVERVLLRGAQDFAMIGQYTRNFGDASKFAEMLRDEGMEPRYQQYFFGCASGVSGQKPFEFAQSGAPN